VTIAAIPVVLILLAFCGVAVQREIKWHVIGIFRDLMANNDSRLMTASLLMMLAALSYCRFRLSLVNRMADLSLQSVCSLIRVHWHPRSMAVV
jgi:hypothetical protein